MTFIPSLSGGGVPNFETLLTNIAFKNIWDVADATDAGGGAISQIDDTGSAGDDFHLVQASNTDRPTLTADSSNGRPGALFNATNETMETTASALADWTFMHDGSGMTYFEVIKPISAPVTEINLSFRTGGSGNQRGLFLAAMRGDQTDPLHQFIVYNGSGIAANCGLDGAAAGAAAPDLITNEAHVVMIRYAAWIPSTFTTCDSNIIEIWIDGIRVAYTDTFLAVRASADAQGKFELHPDAGSCNFEWLWGATANRWLKDGEVQDMHASLKDRYGSA